MRPALAPSIVKCRSGPQPEPVQAVYKWSSVQHKSHDRKPTLVGTLAMDVANGTFEGAASSVLRVDTRSFHVVQVAWCYQVGGTFIICKGSVATRTAAAPVMVARLPDGWCPHRPLLFAALAREACGVEGGVNCRSSLVTLLARPDGWIVKVGGSCSPNVIIDLSAVRFCRDNGILLVDEVTAHTVDVASSRFVALQGYMQQREWSGHSKPLAVLPASCRPPRDLHFIVAGFCHGGFNLLHVCPSLAVGSGAEIFWRDGIWLRDRLSFTGVVYEVASTAMAVAVVDKSKQEVQVRAQVLMRDFHRRLVNQYGTIEEGILSAFGVSGDKEVNFSEFSAGCKRLGLGHKVTHLWDILDHDRSGDVSAQELSGSNMPFLEPCSFLASQAPIAEKLPLPLPE